MSYLRYERGLDRAVTGLSQDYLSKDRVYNAELKKGIVVMKRAC